MGLEFRLAVSFLNQTQNSSTLGLLKDLYPVLQPDYLPLWRLRSEEDL